MFGWIAHIIPRAYTYYISTALFAIFGIKMLKEGLKMSPTGGQEELEEVQSDLRKKEEEVSSFLLISFIFCVDFTRIYFLYYAMGRYFLRLVQIFYK